LLKTLILSTNAILVSFDATALFPSIPIGLCINHINNLLENDTTLSERNKLTPGDIKLLMELCLNSSQFVLDGKFYTAKDSGPIGLSLMVTISDIWITYTRPALFEKKRFVLLGQ
jgi:hypothetical protein